MATKKNFCLYFNECFFLMKSLNHFCKKRNNNLEKHKFRISTILIEFHEEKAFSLLTEQIDPGKREEENDRIWKLH